MGEKKKAEVEGNTAQVLKGGRPNPIADPPLDPGIDRVEDESVIVNFFGTPSMQWYTPTQRCLDQIERKIRPLLTLV